MSQIESFAQAIFAGCSANLGPMIGTELEAGDIAIETSSAPPPGDLAVLPIVCEIDGEPIATLILASPLSEIVTFGRRMQGVEDAPKEGELGDDDLDAIGETLSLMSGAVEQIVREQLNSNICLRPGQWWRSDEPGENSFDEGDHHLASGSVAAPDSSPVHLFLRVPPALFELASSSSGTPSPDAILLLGLAEELSTLLSSTLTEAGIEVRSLAENEEQDDETFEGVSIVVLSGDEKGRQTCRELRSSPSSWALSSLLCMEEPTKEGVIEAVEAGASHILCVPAEAPELLRVIQLLARPA